ncbi:MAG: NAD(P)(+) transhydrogenase (Re/Si-specific) subunit beta [Gammaproteobacteria bacterium]|nr:NAD(P)(+) transhydrogenase (Re/Si-specific) subunit beta [Gammaproteobacteria bacterium]
MSSSGFLLAGADFLAALLLLVGLKAMSHPRTARPGVLAAGAGMLLAVLANLVLDAFGRGSLTLAFLALVALFVGGALSAVLSRRVPMTAMPEMVALFNGLGGAAAALLVFSRVLSGGTPGPLAFGLAVFAAPVGSASFGGSLVAVAKLQDWRLPTGRLPGRRIFTGALMVLSFALFALALFARVPEVRILSAGGALALGFLGGVALTLPIGGADMPVVIAFYNGLTGLAVGFDGVLLHSPAMVVAGVVVGASGTMLTRLMARAMNRSLAAVLFRRFGSPVSSSGPAESEPLATDPADAAVVLAYAREVVIVPGYGMAVAQAQHRLQDLARLLEKRDVRVLFAIHPVAGRMPGHMNVLLAEAGVPYDRLLDLEEANAALAVADAVLVVGANDVVNPDARTNPASPLYGMPVLEVTRAPRVLVIKRGRGRGFSGVENPLFTADNVRLVYGDASDVLGRIIASVREL